MAAKFFDITNRSKQDSNGRTYSEAFFFSIFDLPQELPDIIFEDAYAVSESSSSSLCLIDKSNLQDYAREEVESGHIVTYKVNQWLVNKRWFVQAAKAYLESVVVSAEAGSRVESLTWSIAHDGIYKPMINLRYFQLDDATGVLAALPTSVRTNLYYIAEDGFRHHGRFHRLRNLHVVVCEGRVYEHKSPAMGSAGSDEEYLNWREMIEDMEEAVWTRRLTDSELMEYGPFQVLKQYPGIDSLWSVKLEARDDECEIASGQQAFLQNVARVEELIKEHLLSKNKKPEACKIPTGGTDMLYPGSKVDTKPHIL